MKGLGIRVKRLRQGSAAKGPGIRVQELEG